MSLEEAINHLEETLQEHRQLAEWLVQLKLIIDLVQEYADKETPEKICEDGDGECWGIEATTLLGKIADILKIDRREEVKDDAAD